MTRTVRRTGFPPLGPRRLIRTRLREFTLRTCSGEVRVEAIYGQDAETGEWVCPLRERWGLAPRQTISPLFSKRLCLGATLMPYAECARLSTEWGSPIDDTTIHRLVQNHGARIGERLERETEAIMDPATRESALADWEDPDTGEDDSLVIMVDGWNRRERGADWGLRPANIPANRVRWREVKTGVLFRLGQRGETQSGRRLLTQKRLVIWRGDPAEFGRRLHAEALRRGLRRARRVFLIADGAVWIWNLANDRFKGARQGLDDYHAVQHPRALADALFPDDPDRAKKWWDLRKNRLRYNGLLQVDRLLRELNQRLKNIEPAQAEAVAEEQRYFEKNRDRMDYPALEQSGAPIGSGAVESARAQQQTRYKRPGQFWNGDACQNLVNLHTVRQNDDWDRMWEAKAA